jgi:heme/copper-type cytochrome/quinol oxidase subunit 2
MSAGYSLALLAVCEIAAAVFAAIIISIATFRPSIVVSPRAGARMREVLWALVPIVIVIAAATPALMTMYGAPASEQTVRYVDGPDRVAGKVASRAERRASRQ